MLFFFIFCGYLQLIGENGCIFNGILIKNAVKRLYYKGFYTPLTILSDSDDISIF